MHSMKDAMLKAIKDRRGQGIDLKIMIGKSDDMDKSKDMAPDAPMIDEMDKDEMMKKEMMESPEDEASESPLEQSMEEKAGVEMHPEMAKKAMGQEHGGLNDDAEMLHNMGGEEEIAKPRSLAERAKMALMKKMGKK